MQKYDYFVITFKINFYLCGVFHNQFINIMDFKVQILEALKAKFQGVNANVLNRIADMLSKTVTKAEEVTTAVAGVTQGMIEVIEGYGDSRATEAAQTAVNRYETQHNLKDGKPVVQQGGSPSGGASDQVVTPPAGGSQTDVLLQQLIDQNKKLNERLDKMDGERTTTTRKQKLDDLLGKLPENLRKGYARTPLDGTDEEWNTRFAEVTTEVDALAADLTAKGAVFGRPAAQHGGNQSQDGKLTEEQERAIAHRDGVPAANAQPF